MDATSFSKDFGALNQRLLLVMAETSKNEDLRSSLAITFAVAMATFFVCDVNAIEASERNQSSIITSTNPFSLVLVLSSK